ncbi:putative RNA-directed DNA polymerase [Helianthus annuus]|nr:putative RNA-directed DNA polymerase [Helianthus annuus]KAJ0624195.1 putative RNA-directed DNA polymerase [Helianthus annuus]KAJ0628018.1 putative RNA-directed DNA polymerase [Helianthus annuus]KAJ0784310.1 putative RNA-directed DNA polymerase [Helianthus annuus]KAJ0949339.1 putative RNA-directed DNA polymerase [Helianthus annuus]
MKFYKKFWSHIKPFLVKLMNDFHSSGEISIGCNSSFLALIPKSSDPQNMADYRPISLVGSIYKIISKLLTNRLKVVMDGLISTTQSAFVGGRNILDGPLVVSEVVSWAKKKKIKMMVFKVDFEKACDSINWKFLFRVMELMEFPDKWIGWIKGCLRSGKGSVMVNDSPTCEFPFKRGLRQGDPLSPFLFIIAMQVLDMFMKRALDLGLFHGIKLPNGGPIISHLCYADDVIFIGEWSMHNVVSLNRFLRCLFLVTGLKVNHHKCRLYGLGVDGQEVIQMAQALKCGVGAFPFSYLGVPIGANMKRKIHWQPVVEKFNKRLSSWKARNLSFAGRVTLAKAVLGSLPSYYLSLFLTPKSIIKKLESIRRAFVWGKTALGHKIKWVRWDIMLKPKTLGGLGIGGIRDFNVAMIAKWWWRHKQESSHLWAQVITLIHSTTSNNKVIPVKATMPGIWKDVGGVDVVFSKAGINLTSKLQSRVGNGQNTRFWKDPWATKKPLMSLYPDLYRLAKNKNGMVAENWAGSDTDNRWGWEWINNPNLDSEWQHLGELMTRLNRVGLTGSKDLWVWENGSGVDFSIKDLRLEFAKAGSKEPVNGADFFWNSWAPLKANYLLWRVLLGKVATKWELHNRGIVLQDLDVCEMRLRDRVP